MTALIQSWHVKQGHAVGLHVACLAKSLYVDTILEGTKRVCACEGVCVCVLVWQHHACGEADQENVVSCIQEAQSYGHSGIYQTIPQGVGRRLYRRMQHMLQCCKESH